MRMPLAFDALFRTRRLAQLEQLILPMPWHLGGYPITTQTEENRIR